MARAALAASQALGVIVGLLQSLCRGIALDGELFVGGSVQGPHFGDVSGFLLGAAQRPPGVLPGNGGAFPAGGGVLPVAVRACEEVGDAASGGIPCLEVSGHLDCGIVVGSEAECVGGQLPTAGQGCRAVEGPQGFPYGSAGLLVAAGGLDDLGAGLVQGLFGSVFGMLGCLDGVDRRVGEGGLFGVGGFLGSGGLCACLCAAPGCLGLFLAGCFRGLGDGRSLGFGLLGVLVLACGGRYTGGAGGGSGVQIGQGLLQGQAGVGQQLDGAALGVLDGSALADNVIAGLEKAGGRRDTVAFRGGVVEVLKAALVLQACGVQEPEGGGQVSFKAGHSFAACLLACRSADIGRLVTVRGAGGEDSVGETALGKGAAGGVHGNGGQHLADAVGVEGGGGFDHQQIGQCASCGCRCRGEDEVAGGHAAVGGDQGVEETCYEESALDAVRVAGRQAGGEVDQGPEGNAVVMAARAPQGCGRNGRGPAAVCQIVLDGGNFLGGRFFVPAGGIRAALQADRGVGVRPGHGELQVSRA